MHGPDIDTSSESAGIPKRKLATDYKNYTKLIRAIREIRG